MQTTKDKGCREWSWFLIHSLIKRVPVILKTVSGSKRGSVYTGDATILDEFLSLGLYQLSAHCFLKPNFCRRLKVWLQELNFVKSDPQVLVVCHFILFSCYLGSFWKFFHLENISIWKKKKKPKNISASSGHEGSVLLTLLAALYLKTFFFFFQVDFSTSGFGTLRIQFLSNCSLRI